MDPENPPSIILPIAIMIAILAACGIVLFVLLLIAGLAAI